jgi:hypothetical protein
MASSIKPLVRTYVANGTIPAYTFVKFDTTAPASAKNPRIVIAEASAASCGIAQNASSASSGDEVEVAFPGGGALLKLGAGVSVGQTIMPMAGGVGTPTTAAGDHVGARAVEGGSTSDIIGVHIVQFEKHNSDAV